MVCIMLDSEIHFIKIWDSHILSTKIKVFLDVTQGQIGTNVSEESASVLYVERKTSAVHWLKINQLSFIYINL
jgi:hypothetical protein